MIHTGVDISWKPGVSIWISMPHCQRAICVLFAVLMASFTITVANGEEARIIQLKHRTADEVIPLIRPLLGPDDALTGTDYRLIIRTSDRNLKEIERVLSRMDIAQRQLQITVEQVAADDRSAVTQSLSGEVHIDDKARVLLPEKPLDENGLIVQKDNLRYSANRRSTTTENRSTQTIKTLDGRRAYIRIGQSVPHVKRILALSRHQVTMVQNIEFQNVTTGFEVLPRVQGNMVRIEITPRLSTLENPMTGLANFHEFTTTVDAKLGEWIDLGEIFGNHDEIQRAILESAAMHSDRRHTIRFKIE